MRVAHQRALHVVNSETINHAVLDDGLWLVSDPGKEFFLAGIRSIHVAVEHQAAAVAVSFQWAMTLARPSSISCHVTLRSMPCQAARIYSAIFPSCPVGLGMLMTSLHMETRDFSSTWVRLFSATLGLRPLVVLLAALILEAPGG